MSNQTKEKQPVLKVNNLKKYYPIKRSLGFFKREKKDLKAVDDISFEVYEAETYGIVGESGCGKSTTGKSILRLLEPTAGEAYYNGKNIFSLSRNELINIRQDLQMIFQDPYSSLNPNNRIGQILEEPLKIHNIGTKHDRVDRVMELLNIVGMATDHYYRYPHELSGGQRQRIGVARALIANPKLVICDEPVSALDVSVQSQIINLLGDLQDELKLAYLFITHDISVVKHVSDRIGVMYLGKIVEEAPTDSLFKQPLHPYTEALLSAVPRTSPGLKKDRIILKGEVPSPLNPPLGCVFHKRCPMAMDICSQKAPERKEVSKDHFVSCFLHE